MKQTTRKTLKFIIFPAFLLLACISPEIESTSESTKLPRKFCNKNVPKSDKEAEMVKKLHLVTIGMMAKTVNENLVKLKESSATTTHEEIVKLEERAAKLNKAKDDMTKGKEIDYWSKMEVAKIFLMKSTKLPPTEWYKLTADERDEFSEELRCMIEGLWKGVLKDSEWGMVLEELWANVVKDEL